MFYTSNKLLSKCMYVGKWVNVTQVQCTMRVGKRVIITQVKCSSVLIRFNICDPPSRHHRRLRSLYAPPLCFSAFPKSLKSFLAGSSSHRFNHIFTYYGDIAFPTSLQVGLMENKQYSFTILSPTGSIGMRRRNSFIYTNLPFRYISCHFYIHHIYILCIL